VGDDVTVGSRDEVRVARTLAADTGNSIATLAAWTSYLLEATWFYLVLVRNPRRGTCFTVTYRQRSRNLISAMLHSRFIYCRCTNTWSDVQYSQLYRTKRGDGCGAQVTKVCTD